MNDTTPLAALADIELPAPPDWRPLIAAALILLLCAMGAWILHKYRRRRRDARALAPAPGDALGPEAPEDSARAALARLEALQQEWRAGTVDARAAAYRLGTLLRLGLKLPQLHPAAPPAGLDADAWRETLTGLQDQRYARTISRPLTPETFARARAWLDRPERTDV